MAIRRSRSSSRSSASAGFSNRRRPRACSPRRASRSPKPAGATISSSRCATAASSLGRARTPSRRTADRGLRTLPRRRPLRARARSPLSERRSRSRAEVPAMNESAFDSRARQRAQGGSARLLPADGRPHRARAPLRDGRPALALSALDQPVRGGDRQHRRRRRRRRRLSRRTRAERGRRSRGDHDGGGKDLPQRRAGRPHRDAPFARSRARGSCGCRRRRSCSTGPASNGSSRSTWPATRNSC